MPNKISGDNEPLTSFSTERALTHLKNITKTPHYTGSQEHKNVQRYIANELRELGLEVEIQKQTAINKKWRAGTNTHNIIAKLTGTDSSRKALLLLSHYDSSPHSSLGASDAGSGIVTILEGIRAFLLKNGQPTNDIVVLISDAEELGLLGASAFVNKHPWAKNIGLVLNFEARGSGGPSYMLLETNNGNKKLIEHFKEASPKYPVATSLLYSIYKMLPNDTDLTIFREDGNIQGYNFAFIDDHFDYHTAQDNFERLDKNSLEHQAAYLMPLLYHFSNADLSTLKSEDDYVYFNLSPFGLIYYPFSWILPLVISISIVFIVLLYYANIKGKINTKHFFKGLFVFIKFMLISALLTYYGWKLLLKIHPQYNDILHGFTYNGHSYIAAFIVLTISLGFLFYSKYQDSITPENFMLSPIIFWVIINILVAIYLKGASYFIIALLFGVIALFILIFSKKSTQSQQIILTLLSIPILLIFAPMIQMIPVGLGLKVLFVSSIFTVLIFSLLIPIFLWYKNGKRLGKLFLALAIIIFISASFTSNYNEERKKPNSIIYVLDADKNEAYWASYETKVDEFTKQFLGESPIKGSFDNSTSASKYNSSIRLHKKAEIKDIEQPVIEIYIDTIVGDKRYIGLDVVPQRSVNRIELMANNKITFYDFKVNMIDYPKAKGYDHVLITNRKFKKGMQLLNYYITDPGEFLRFEFSVPKDKDPSLTLYESSFDLHTSTNFSIKPRDKTMMPKPFVLNDAVVVKKQINLNKK